VEDPSKGTAYQPSPSGFPDVHPWNPPPQLADTSGRQSDASGFAIFPGPWSSPPPLGHRSSSAGSHGSLGSRVASTLGGTATALFAGPQAVDIMTASRPHAVVFMRYVLPSISVVGDFQCGSSGRPYGMNGHGMPTQMAMIASTTAMIMRLRLDASSFAFFASTRPT